MSKKMKKILVIMSMTLVLSITLASLAFAYQGGIRGIGLLVSFFLTFGIVIVLAQLIPAAILIFSFFGAVLSSLKKREIPSEAA